MQASERILGRSLPVVMSSNMIQRKEKSGAVKLPAHEDLILDPVLHTHKEFSITPLYPPMSIPHYLPTR